MFGKLKQMILLKGQYAIAGICLFLLSGCVLPGMPPDTAAATPEEAYQNCWPCQVYQTTFEAIDKIVDTLAKNSCNYALTLLGLGILFWLLFHVGKFVTTMKQPNIREFLFPMTTLLFKGIIIASLIGLPTGSESRPYLLDIVGEDVVQPLLDFFSDLTKTILDSNDTVKNATVSASVSDFFLDKIKEVTPNKTLDHTLFGKSGGPLIDVVYRVFTALSVGVNLGFHIFKAENAGFVEVLFGLFIIFMFWMMLLTLPLSFLDALARICAMLILLPFLLVAWIFPSTKHMLGKAWGVLLGSGILILFTGFYVALVVYMIETYAKAHEHDFPVFSSAAQETDPMLVMQIETLTPTTVGFFVLMLALNKLSMHIPSLANQFGGEAVGSSMIRVFNGVKQLSIAAGKAALALALASPAIAKQAADDAKEVAKDMAKGSGGIG